MTVDVSDDTITLQGERSDGSFRRVIPLPEGAMSDQAKAAFRDGVLEIRMPAPPASKGRRLEITAGAAK